MEERVDRHVEASDGPLLGPPAAARDADGALRDRLRRVVAERRDHLRLDQLDLPHQVRHALLDLLGQRIAVPGRAALEDVRHKDLAPRQADLAEQGVEELPGAPHERLALLVLGGAGGLADEHQVGVGVAHAEDDVRSRPRERAAVLVVQLAVELDQIGAAFLGWAPHGSEAYASSWTGARPPVSRAIVSKEAVTG